MLGGRAEIDPVSHTHGVGPAGADDVDGPFAQFVAYCLTDEAGGTQQENSAHRVSLPHRHAGVT